MRLFLDDLLQVRIGDLDILPDDYRKGVALVERPVPAAVAFEWNTHVDPPFVVLTHERTRTTLLLTSERANFGGSRWYFIGSDGRKALKVRWVPGHDFDSRGALSALGVHPRSRHLSTRKRLRLSQERTAEKLRELRVHWPSLARKERLEAKLEWLRRKLAREELGAP
jgi:hypothetical protein